MNRPNLSSTFHKLKLDLWKIEAVRSPKHLLFFSQLVLVLKHMRCSFISCLLDHFRPKFKGILSIQKGLNPFLTILKLRKNWNYNLCSSEIGEDFLVWASISEHFEIYQAWETIFRKTTRNENFLKCIIVVSLLYHIILWFCPAKLWKKSGHPKKYMLLLRGSKNFLTNLSFWKTCHYLLLGKKEAHILNHKSF